MYDNILRRILFLYQFVSVKSTLKQCDNRAYPIHAIKGDNWKMAPLQKILWHYRGKHLQTSRAQRPLAMELCNKGAWKEPLQVGKEQFGVKRIVQSILECLWSERVVGQGSAPELVCESLPWNSKRIWSSSKIQDRLLYCRERDKILNENLEFHICLWRKIRKCNVACFDLI